MRGSSAAATLGWLVVLAPLVVLAAEDAQVVREGAGSFCGAPDGGIPVSARSYPVLFLGRDASKLVELPVGYVWTRFAAEKLCDADPCSDAMAISVTEHRNGC